MVYVAHEAWDCLVCRWQGNTTWFCAKCGRRQDIATDAVRWGKFLMDAEIVTKDEENDGRVPDLH